MTITSKNIALATSSPVKIRGGRMTKWKGCAASMSPVLGQLIVSTSPLALAGAAFMLIGVPAQAQDICTETVPGSGIFDCTGDSDDTQTLSAAGTPLIVNLDETATVNTTVGGGSGGTAIQAFGNAGTDFVQAADGGEIIGSAFGIEASTSEGTLSVTTTGIVAGLEYSGISASNGANAEGIAINAVETFGGEIGIAAENRGSGSLSITTTGETVGASVAGIFAQNYANAADLTIIAGGDTGGQQYGIFSRNGGSGALSISTAGSTVGIEFDAINAANAASGTDLEIVTGGFTIGDRNGIFADNNGSGALSITTVGNIEGLNGAAINASNSTSGTDLTIVTEGDTTGGEYGIYTRNAGTGALSITTSGTTTGTIAAGIFAENSNLATDLTVAAGGNTYGGEYGIFADNYGTGALSITTAGTTVGALENGIDANNSVYSTDLSIVTGGDTGGGQNGIVGDNSGTGALSITTAGDTIGIDDTGIFARNSIAGTNLSIVTGGATTGGGDDGINAVNSGTGAMSMVTNGATTGRNIGIVARNDAGTTSMLIDARGDVTGGQTGIDAENNGSEGLTISVSGDVTGETQNGILAYNSANDVTASMVINQAAGTTTQGGINGISAENAGGSLTINALGTSIGETDNGIDAINLNTATDLTINSNNTTGNQAGISAYNLGTGALTITSSGTAQGTERYGILANNSGAGSDLTINAFDSNGGLFGIAAGNTGTGALSIATTGTTLGSGTDGIFALNFVGSSSLTIDAQGLVIGGESGINATNLGTAGLTVSVSGDVLGETRSGILAANSANDVTGTMAINQSEGTTTEGAIHGIEALNASGSLTINALGMSTGQTGAGIYALNQATATDLTIVSNVAQGAEYGILADNEGSGALTVTTTGSSTGETFFGIAAFNRANATDLTIDAAETEGGWSGIFATNLGSGALAITTTGSATGGISNGIAAINSAAGTSLDVDAGGAVTGGQTGILARNFGTAGLTVSVSGDVTGETEDGISAYNSANDVTASMVINQAEGTTTTGAINGIDADNAGGSLTINALGTSIGLSDNGINAQNQATATDLTITSNVAQGGEIGILANNEGTGALSITSTGSSTGETYFGIFALNAASGTDLTIDAATSSGANVGILATNFGTGALRVATTGQTTGTLVDGILAVNMASGTSLAIDAQGTVTGGENGITARNFGTEGLSISVSGDVTGEMQNGITAFNSANDVTASMVINQAEGTTTTGLVNGIDAQNAGGSLTINALGTSRGLVGNGIRAINEATATDLTIVSNIAQGDTTGIFAENLGTGALSITSLGNSTGNQFSGILASNSLNGTDLTIMAADTSGFLFGIDAANYGSGDLSITTTGASSADVFAGIIAVNSIAGGDLTIEAGGDVTGAETGILANNLSAGTVAIDTAGTVDGGIDGINVQSAGGSIDIANSGILNTGTGFAIMSSGGVTSVENSGIINGRIQLSAFDDSVTNSGLFSADSDSDFGAGADTFVNSGTVNADGVIAFLGLESFTNIGSVSLVDGVVGDSLSLAGDYVGEGGTLALDVDFAGAGSADTLVIAGAATGTTIVDVNDVSGGLGLLGNTILIVDADAGSDENAFVTASPIIASGFLAYDVIFEAPTNDYFLTNAISTPVFQALKFAEGAQSLWYRSADAWSGHMSSLRDAPTDSKLWFQMYGSTSERDQSLEYTSGGFTQDITLDYDQDYFGGQFGVDFGTELTGDNSVVFGLTGGYLNSTLGFDGYADRVEYDAFNIGAYAQIRSGGLFANLLAKYDFISGDVIAPGAGYNADIDGSAYGVRAEAGYRFGDDGFFAEPVARLEYQRSELDSFSALGAEFDFDNWDGLRGMAGIRLGGKSEISRGSKLTYYAAGHAVREFAGDDGLVFSMGASSEAIVNHPVGTFGRAELGINVETVAGVTGFIEANADYSADYESYGARAGLRIRF